MGEVRYSVKQLARLAGVSVRTLHVYDKMGLLKPSVRTDARYRLDTLLNTIDNTIDHLKNKTMSNLQKLYEGLEDAAALRQEAIDNWGESAILRSENALLEMGPDRLEWLKSEQRDIDVRLRSLVDEDPNSDVVQEQIARHYDVIRGFWGMGTGEAIRAVAYKGLGEPYASDERYTAAGGHPDPRFAAFMRTAMGYFADTRLA